MGSNDKDDEEAGLVHVLPAPKQTEILAGLDPNLKVFVVVGFYFTVSISLVFLNKAVFKSYSFPYPVFVTWFQVLIAVGVSYVFGIIGRHVSALSFFPPYEFKMDVAQRVAPLSLVFVAMVVLNNMCLQLVEVSFYQVVRSLSIILNVVMSYTILGNKTSVNAMKCCAVVVVGFWIGVIGEDSMAFTWMGVFFGVSSSFFVALYSIYVKKVLPAVENNEWKLMFYNNTNAAFMFIPVLLMSGEIEMMMKEIVIMFPRFWVMLTLTGLFGFLINIAIFLQIKVTTPLTGTISGTAKACLQTALSVVLFGNVVTFWSAVGILTTIVGSTLYGYTRYIEMTNK